MLVPRPFITYMAGQLTRRLAQGAIEVKSAATVTSAFDAIIFEQLKIEDEINSEAREILNQYADYMRQNAIPYHEMFNRVKRKLLQERKVTASAAKESEERGMKISRDKLTELSHKLAAQLPRIEGVRVLKGWNDVRLEIASGLGALFNLEQKVDDQARAMIAGQKRQIPEGSEEWNVLHRRYYDQQMQKLGVNLSPEPARRG